MKNLGNVLFAAALAVLMAASPSCRLADDSVANFAAVFRVDWRYESSADGARLLLRNLVVKFSNDTGAPAEGKVFVEWGNGRTEESSVSLPATEGKEYLETFWTESEHGDQFAFHGELTVTIRLTMQFMGVTSPAYEKTLTMKSL